MKRKFGISFKFLGHRKAFVAVFFCNGLFKRRLFSVACVGLALGLPHAQAGLFDWTGATGANWATGSNWTNGVAPSNGDSVRFTSGANLVTTNNLTNLQLTQSSGYSLLIDSGAATTIRGNQISLRSGSSGELGLFGAGAHTIAASSAGPYSGTYFSFDQGFTTSGWNGSTFTITAIPEPTTCLAAIGLALLFLGSSLRLTARGVRSSGSEVLCGDSTAKHLLPEQKYFLVKFIISNPRKEPQLQLASNP